MGSLSKSLGDDLPASINRADPALVALIQRFQEMRREIAATANAVVALANALVAGGNTPTPLVLEGSIGPNPQGGFE